MAEPSEHRITVDDVELVYLEMGDGPLALCLHGFPDTPLGWRPLLPRLAEAGYRAVAPWLRGYAPSSVPADGLAPAGSLVADALGLHDALGGGRPGVLIGHDWGALTAYGAAALAPDRWDRLVTLSIPPTAFMAGRLFDYAQIRAFWYQYVFLQDSAEMIVSYDDLAFLDGLWADWSPGHTHPDAVAAAKDALRGPANLTAALSTYRTMLGTLPVPERWAAAQGAMLLPAPQPTLYLHGPDDGCVPDVDVDAVAALLPEGSRALAVPGAGHFLQYDQPGLVVEAILDFLA